MSSGMNVKEAEKIADKMSYREAIMNCLHAKCVPYRKATKIKLNELLEIAENADKAYQQGRADAIEEYKERILEDLIPLKDKYFDLVKGTTMPERYTNLKRMYTVELIIEQIKLKSEQMQKGAEE